MNENTDHNHRQLSELEEEMLATFQDDVAELAEKAAAGEEVDAILAQMLESLPDGLKTEITEQYQALVIAIQQDRGTEPELSLQQQEEMRIHKESARMALANWLSEKTLEKIRRAILSRPGFLMQVLNIGEELHKKGVLVHSQQFRNSELGQVVSGTAQQQGFKKETTRER